MDENRKKARLFEWAQIICGALACIALLYTFVFRMVDVDGSSMETTLRDGERLILSSLPYEPAYEDIVVIARGETQEPLIKRVIGLPGDTIFIEELTGEVYRNDKLLKEKYIHVPTATELMTGKITVPEGCVFVMGDNREKGHSLDSRSIGCVKIENIVGKAVYRLLPFDRQGGLYE